MAILAATGTRPVLAGPQAAPPTATELRTRAVYLAYNLDYEEALTLLRKAVQLAPDDPAPHRTLATVLWLQLLFMRGSVTVDHYLGTFSRGRVQLEPPPPAMEAEFRRHVEQARTLAEARLASAPADVQARFDLGIALGLQASYTATVEGRMMAGFRAARRSFDLHEGVLEKDPRRADAGVIVGMYRYIVSTLSLPMRALAYVVGFGGGREQGIDLVRAAARSDTESRADALFALVLIYNREGRYDEALAVLRELRAMFPRNRLVVLEAGATALRAGQGAAAEKLLDEGMAMLVKDRRARVPGEIALWHLKRGGARALTGRRELAEADLKVASGPDAQAWVGGRARLELARLALARGDKATARDGAAEAHAFCQRGNDPVCAESARRLQRSASGR